MEAYMWVVWLVVFVGALIIEGMGSELVSIWFAAGSIVALIVSFIPEVAWWIQLIIFAVISVASLVCLRPIIHKALKRTVVSSNVDELIHKKGRMTKGCDEFNHGEVKIGGVLWTAYASDEKTPISEGATVEVLAIEGNKLVVKEVKN
ncbi:MAG: NfeD family protein [Bacilli bacterium]|nr:NfeD family protein [Bacilli bacterium]